MTLSPDQTAALTAFRAFLARPEELVFLLWGHGQKNIFTEKSLL